MPSSVNGEHTAAEAVLTGTFVLQFLSVLELDEKTPAIVLLYRSYTPSDGIEHKRWGHSQHAKDPDMGDRISRISATPDYQPDKQRFEQKFKLSVLLPVGPLGFGALGRLNNDTGCAVCEEQRSSRCSQCQSFAYYGAGTYPCCIGVLRCRQPAEQPVPDQPDWPAHKATRHSLQGGRWVTVDFRTALPGLEGEVTEWVRRLGVDRGQGLLRTRTETSAVPPNVHSEKVFVVKLQGGMEAAAATILVYDRQHSFEDVLFLGEDDPETYAALVAEVRGRRGGEQGVKMHRWARRIGDYRLSICLDRQPATPKW
ncbi:hypothetical protein DICSQDRAFT_171585 [Dichomitus squalens LYAD-421 SS1]|uniref:MYND-type domain-containing protein n=1 Tax=Dichomitus squalens (strain LYAD-421) TaxID=732165 RepID=R7SXZ5_DICSQ|nr:uncharacterized protein DICSQDRAFT_171585 [Dichomitus squalens LYAD-421 SS1]EJF59852.1 hypothetical protein DICSQDRAFT_171585 [Dichomitus squalens LYAD-421 SS1]